MQALKTLASLRVGQMGTFTVKGANEVVDNA